MSIDHLSRPARSSAAASIAAALAFALGAGPTSAQWTVTNLHPAGATESYAFGVGSGPGGAPQQVGYVTIAGVARAALWSGSAASWTDLHPTGPAAASVTNSIALGVGGGQQVGVAYIGSTTTSAALWSGTAASWQNIGPPGIPFQPPPVSQANGIQNGVVVGSAGNTSGTSAARWDAGILTTLPNSSTAAAIDGGAIVGSVRISGFPTFRSAAMLWTGSPVVATSLQSPGLYSSFCTGVSGTQQVGTVIIGQLGGPTHAYLWTGSAAAFVDLHPAGATGSEAAGVSAGTQAGSAKFLIPAVDPQNSVSRAGIWTGTAASWTSLHAFLPATFRDSFAKSIHTDATGTYVAGYGTNTATNRIEALLWSMAACGCPADFDCSGTLAVADIFSFLNAWFAGATAADFDHINGLQVADIFAFLNAWFAGC